MWNKLNLKRKHLLLYLLMVFITYLAWVFSFKNAFLAIKLNQDLSRNESNSFQLDGTSPLVSRKREFYLRVVKSYKVKQADVEGHIWQALSAIAIHHSVDISLETNSEVVLDTVQDVKSFDFLFKGSYGQIVKLLDSVNTSAGIGRPSAIELSRSVADNEATDKLRLKLRLSVLK